MRNDLLLALRTQRGWTQEELSERSGISVRTIRNLERGRIQSPRRSSLDLLFSVLDPDLRGGAGAPTGSHFTVGGIMPFPAAELPGGQAMTGLGLSAMPGLVGRGAIQPPPGRWRGPRPPRAELIGRDTDLDRLREIVTAHPVTVLTGPGGVGKTRLALAVAERCAPEFRGGVAVAQLGRITVASGPGGGDGPAALSAAKQTIAELLGEEQQPRSSGPALLILDTTEHLPQVTALLVEHLRGAWPDLRLLITTRRPPVLPEARIWETTPLSPDSAVELMYQRLATSSLNDDLTGSPDLVRQLCGELDCLPRLIEFAAYWLRSVPVSALLSPEHVLELLGFPDFSVLPHQRSLLSCLQWSWDMLSDRQRRFLIRLADQPEPVSSDARELISMEPGLSGAEAVCLLAELADASMLQVRRGHRYEYRMLRHVRAFVRQRAQRAGASAAHARQRVG